jgi:hypothetical protein
MLHGPCFYSGLVGIRGEKPVLGMDSCRTHEGDVGTKTTDLFLCHSSDQSQTHGAAFSAKKHNATGRPLHQFRQCQRTRVNRESRNRAQHLSHGGARRSGIDEYARIRGHQPRCFTGDCQLLIPSISQPALMRGLNGKIFRPEHPTPHPPKHAVRHQLVDVATDGRRRGCGLRDQSRHGDPALPADDSAKLAVAFGAGKRFHLIDNDFF